MAATGTVVGWARTVVPGVVVLLLAGCNGGSQPVAVATPSGTAAAEEETVGAEQTVEVDMVDIAFEPSTLRVTRGQAVRFVFHNEGAVAHDAFIGDGAAQEAHEAQMRSMGDHAGHGDDESGSAITVAPGGTGELRHVFAEPAELLIGCHQPGHYQAGMKLTIELR